ncbi:DNA alkylation repair protein [Thermomonospora catenispora]|uniref:DNA alkylation repair protein n=1 Tax=Thermomonospora catenispora TaxID=2493090 RepID=UPI001122BFB8|nr:DNA alkylation repair protein [Thermomonospora catenispora]TNY38247.1 DNA alkylation repair protein [Thermomonospora catenispora]
MDVAEVMRRVEETFRAHADPDRAAPMAAYMRGRFPFLGIATPRRRALTRRVLAGLPSPAEAELCALARSCWALPEREFQYFACDVLIRCAAVPSAGFAATLRELLTARSWWDTVDPLATRVVGALARREPAVAAVTDEWAAGPDPWLNRAALLHQLTYKEATDPERLFRHCRMCAGREDFFVRKAVGWALRRYAEVAPDAVRAFVAAEEDALSPLSVREALRNLR